MELHTSYDALGIRNEVDALLEKWGSSGISRGSEGRDLSQLFLKEHNGQLAFESKGEKGFLHKLFHRKEYNFERNAQHLHDLINKLHTQKSNIIRKEKGAEFCKALTAFQDDYNKFVKKVVTKKLTPGLLARKILGRKLDGTKVNTEYEKYKLDFDWSVKTEKAAAVTPIVKESMPTQDPIKEIFKALHAKSSLLSVTGRSALNEVSLKEQTSEVLATVVHLLSSDDIVKIDTQFGLSESGKSELTKIIKEAWKEKIPDRKVYNQIENMQAVYQKCLDSCTSLKDISELPGMRDFKLFQNRKMDLNYKHPVDTFDKYMQMPAKLFVAMCRRDIRYDKSTILHLFLRQANTDQILRVIERFKNQEGGQDILNTILDSERSDGSTPKDLLVLNKNADSEKILSTLGVEKPVIATHQYKDAKLGKIIELLRNNIFSAFFETEIVRKNSELNSQIMKESDFISHVFKFSQPDDVAAIGKLCKENGYKEEARIICRYIKEAWSKKIDDEMKEKIQSVKEKQILDTFKTMLENYNKLTDIEKLPSIEDVRALLKDESLVTALHIPTHVCYEKMPVELVHKLLEIPTKKSDNTTLLHTLLGSMPNSEIDKFMNRNVPKEMLSKVLASQDNTGKTPLHVLMKNLKINDYSLIPTMVTKMEKKDQIALLTMKDKAGNFPFTGAAAKVLQALLDGLDKEVLAGVTGLEEEVKRRWKGAESKEAVALLIKFYDKIDGQEKCQAALLKNVDSMIRCAGEGKTHHVSAILDYYGNKKIPDDIVKNVIKRTILYCPVKYEEEEPWKEWKQKFK